MPFKLKLKLSSGDEILSPIIEPNNPCHDRSHPSVAREINKTGASMKRRLPDVVEYECVAVCT